MNPVLKTVMTQLLPKRLLLARIPGSREVALTFDDGPHPVHTPRILDILREERVPATFFLLGSEVEKHPALAQAIVRAGHALGNHSFSHGRMHGMTMNGLAREIERTAELIERTTGAATRLFRPPRGTVTWPLLRYAWRRGWTIVLWSLDSEDCRPQATAAATRAVLGRTRPGDIVLLHEDYAHTADGLREWIRDLKARGLSFTTVDHLAGAAP